MKYKPLKQSNVLIVGLGLIGGSYARSLKEYGCDVNGIDKNLDTINYAKINKIINNKYPDDKLIENADVIIVCLYPNDTISWIKANVDKFKHGAIITDVTGVKGKVVEEITKIVKHQEFVSHHPMAGKESSGILNSSSDLFKNANFIITPTLDNSTEAIEVIKEISFALKFSNCEILTPEAHDEIIGYLSQLTHAIAVSLMTAKDTNHYITYTGDSFRDLTRIAKINENLWSELFFLNKEVLINEIEVFQDSLNRLKQSLINEDSKALKEQFISSTISRNKFDDR